MRGTASNPGSPSARWLGEARSEVVASRAGMGRPNEAPTEFGKDGGAEKSELFAERFGIGIPMLSVATD